MPIRQLAPDVAAKIAAGEVVERPASVVKELIENSIDAGATQIRIDLMQGGLQLIRVSDNGAGIPPDELSLALARHATSKVAQIEDLERIRSLGFRGEALASIAAVAEVTLLSRQRGAEQGAQIGATNGQFSAISAAASPEGTTVTVRDLFSAVPARLKFLKSRNTEISHCHHLLEQYALAYPEIRFSVFSDGRQIFATPGDGQLFSVLVEVYGLQVAEQMVALSGAERSDDAEYPIVSGYVSRPSCYKSTRQHISFFVNRRWVMSRLLTSAVEGAYHSLLLTGRHPIAVVNIQLDPALLDVNVHPAKTEIRFLKERRVFAAVLRAVRQALLEEPAVPQWKPRRDQAAQTERPVEADPLEELDFEEPELDAVAQTSAPAHETEAPAFPPDNPWLTVTEEETGTKPPITARLWQSHVRRPESGERNSTPAETDQSPAPAPAQRHDAQTSAASHASVEQPAVEQQPAQHAAQSGPGAPVKQGELGLEQRVTAQAGQRLPRLRVIGQLAQSFIVTEGEDGMYLIDQHAAHERILMERMVADLKARTPVSQLLLTPITLELAPRELEAIEDHQSQLEAIGFALEPTGDGALLVHAVPGVLVKRVSAQSVHELLIELTAPENLGHTETWEERALANVACKAAIKAHYFLTMSEMQELLVQLGQTQAPFSCCHGRPTMMHFSLPALEHEFERR
jgi:DNA mismatch repair protein MutL